MIICKNCNKENDNKSKYCQFCGHPLFKTCIKCGSEMNSESTYCTNCGFNNSEESIKILDKNIITKKNKIKKVLIISLLVILFIFLLKAFTVIKTNQYIKKANPLPIFFSVNSNENNDNLSFQATYLYPSVNNNKYHINSYSITENCDKYEIAQLINDGISNSFINATYFYDGDNLFNTRNIIESDEYFSRDSSWNAVYSSQIEKIKYTWPWNWKNYEIELENNIKLNKDLFPFELQDIELFESSLSSDQLKINHINNTDPIYNLNNIDRKKIEDFIPENKEAFYFSPIWDLEPNELFSYSSVNSDYFTYSGFYKNIEDALNNKITGLWYWDYVLKFGYFDKQIIIDSNGEKINDKNYEYWQVKLSNNKTYIYKFEKDYKYYSTSLVKNYSLGIDELKPVIPFFNQESLVPGSTVFINGCDGNFRPITKYILSNGETIKIQLFNELQELESLISLDSKRINFAENLSKYNIGTILIDEENNRIWINGIDDYHTKFYMYIGYIPNNNYSYTRGVLPSIEVSNSNSKIQSITFISNDNEYSLNMEDIDQDVYPIKSLVSDETKYYITIDFLVKNNIEFFEEIVKKSELSIRIKIDDTFSILTLNKDELKNLDEIMRFNKLYLNSL